MYKVYRISPESFWVGRKQLVFFERAYRYVQVHLESLPHGHDTVKQYLHVYIMYVHGIYQDMVYMHFLVYTTICMYIPCMYIANN